MGEFGKVVQLKSESDGCVYICHIPTGKWQKLCDIEVSSDLPDDIKEQIRIMRKAVED